MSEERDDGLGDAGLPERDAPRGPAWQRAHVILMGLVGVGLLAWLATGFYTVRVGEVALVERLGQYVRTPDGTAEKKEPGTHFGLPWPIDQVFRVPVQKVQTVEARSFNPQPTDNMQLKHEWANEQIPATFITAVLDPYLITGDRNVIHMAVTMQYHIVDPEQYLQSVAESRGHSSEMREQMLQQLVEHEMIVVISKLKVGEVLAMQVSRAETGGSEEETLTLVAPRELDTEVRKLFSGALGAKFGILVDSVTVTQTRPPQQAADAFTAVTNARMQKKGAMEKAKAEKSAAISKASAEADAAIKAAQAYGQQVKDKAEGEAQQFKQVWEKYQLYPAVTKFDLYQTALADVTRSAKRIYFVEEGQLLYITIAPPEGVVTTPGGGAPGGGGGGPPR